MKSALAMFSVGLLAFGAYAAPALGAGDGDDGNEEGVKSAGDAAKGDARSQGKRKKRSVKKNARVGEGAEPEKESGQAGGTQIDAVDPWGSDAQAASAGGPVSGFGDGLVPNWGALGGPRAAAAFPFVELHGYYRVRADLFHNLHLDTWTSDSGGTSPVRPPLTESLDTGKGHPENPNARFSKGSDSLASANMRFRVQPTLHVSENLRVHSTLDLLDNLVLGSTPNTGILSSDGIATEQYASGQDALEDTIRVKHVWGEWRNMLGVISFGRMPAHWGLGMLYNAGSGLDDDYGDAVDRIMGTFKLSDMYLSLSWDFPSEGVVGKSGQFLDQESSLGQAHDLDQRDDVTAISISLFRKPVTDDEWDEREQLLYKDRKWAFDWGAYGLFYHHDLLSDGKGSDVRLREVEATIYVPDFWLSFERQWRGRGFFKRYLKLGLEGALAAGKVKEVPQRAGEQTSVCYETGLEASSCPGSETYNPRRRELLQWGYAFELDSRFDKLRLGFRHGTASGDKTEGFGVLDQTAFDSTASDKDLNAFTFDRAYTVDLILFRELVGAVTNASYFKPSIGYDFILQDREAWGFTFSALYAFALEKDATPGDDRNLGLEFDVEFFIHEYDRFKWSLAYGLLFPGAAWNLLDEATGKVIKEAGIAQTLQMNLGIEF